MMNDKNNRETSEKTWSRELSTALDDEQWIQIAKLTELGLSMAAVVHEARQPLSVVKMALQLGKESLDKKSEVYDYVSDALGGLARLEKLLDQVREFLLPPSGEATQEDLTEVAENVVGVYQTHLKRGGVDLVLELERGLPLVLVEKSKIEQVLINLLVNARDAVDGVDRPQIVLVVRQTDSQVIEVVVGDNGGGVDDELREKIFNPFFSTKTRGKGSGLGLYIARRIAEQHQAKLALLPDSELRDLGYRGLTTAFCIRFHPARSVKQSAEPETIEGLAPILVVDDEQVIVKLLAQLVKMEGMSSVTAASGEEAVEILRTTKVSAVIADKNLPGLSGLDIARQARDIRPETRVILITGYASEDSAVQAAALGVDDYLIKPLDVSDFRERLRKLREDLASSQVRSSRPPPHEQRRHAAMGSRRDWRGDPSRPEESPRARAASIPPEERPTVTARSGVSTSAAPGSGARGERARSIPPTVVQRSSIPSSSSWEEGDSLVSVLLVESERQTRSKIIQVLSTAGARVSAFASTAQADAHVRTVGFDVLVAPAEILTEKRKWFYLSAGDRPLGCVAIMERGGLDKTVEAIHLGARGLLVPPYEKNKVVDEFRRAVGRMLEEREQADQSDS